MKKIFSLGLLALFFLSCSKTTAPTPQDVAKKIRVEVNFTGDMQFYQLAFSINSFSKGKGTFVTPIITTPANTSWTKVIAQSNNYMYIGPITAPSFAVAGSEPGNQIAFSLSSFQVSKMDSSITPLKGTINVFADGKVVQTYTYQTTVGQVTPPMSESIDLTAQ